MKRSRLLMAWAATSVVTLYLALFATLNDWMAQVWPDPGVLISHEHFGWGVGVLWFAFAGSAGGLVRTLRSRRSRNDREG